MAVVHHSPTAMHHLRGINALLSAVSVHYFSGIFNSAQAHFFRLLFRRRYRSSADVGRPSTGRPPCRLL